MHFMYTQLRWLKYDENYKCKPRFMNLKHLCACVAAGGGGDHFNWFL